MSTVRASSRPNLEGLYSEDRTTGAAKPERGFPID